MKNIKNCQLKNLQKQQEDMKVAMLVYVCKIVADNKLIVEKISK